MNLIPILAVSLFAAAPMTGTRAITPSPAPFSITLERTDNSWSATCATGCRWTAVKVTCEGACAVIIDDRGMRTSAAGRNRDERFAFVVEGAGRGWRARSYAGTGWTSLGYNCRLAVCRAQISESGVAEPGAPLAALAPRREVGAVFIGMAQCCDALTADLKGPIDSVRTLLRNRALRADYTFRMIGVSLDWRPEDGWNYLKQFGEFDEVGLGSNWYGLQPEALMFSDTNVQPSVPQLVIYERLVTREMPKPTFSPRRVLKAFHKRDEIVAWLRAGAPLP
jgi:hypothetical protein